jgi:hypothetical protein
MLSGNPGAVLGCARLHEVIGVGKLPRPLSDGKARVADARNTKVGVTGTHDWGSREL